MKHVKFIFEQEPGRRISMTPSSKFGGSFLRRGRTPSMKSNASQSTLGGESVTGNMSRAGSITSVFRRIFSRDRGDRVDPQSPSVQDGPIGGEYFDYFGILFKFTYATKCLIPDQIKILQILAVQSLGSFFYILSYYTATKFSKVQT